MASESGPRSPRAAFLLVLAILGVVAVPAALTLRTVHVGPAIDGSVMNPSPYGYSVSLLLFLVPTAVIGLWLIPLEGVPVSKKSFGLTIAILFPIGALLDFCFATKFFTFPNPDATLRIAAPAIGGSVPVEEYVFYLSGFVFMLLLYIWLDEYWLGAYSVPNHHWKRTSFTRLLQFHPLSLLWAGGLIAAAIGYKEFVVQEPGFPGYFTFLVLAALAPSAALFPSALPVINWRALSLQLFLVLLISLLWEATLALPYGWWGFQDAAMIGIRVTAWSRLPIEEVVVWVAVSYATVIVYENVRRWQSSGKRIGEAFLGSAAKR